MRVFNGCGIFAYCDPLVPANASDHNSTSTPSVRPCAAVTKSSYSLPFFDIVYSLPTVTCLCPSVPKFAKISHSPLPPRRQYLLNTPNFIPCASAPYRIHSHRSSSRQLHCFHTFGTVVPSMRMEIDESGWSQLPWLFLFFVWFDVLTIFWACVPPSAFTLIIVKVTKYLLSAAL